MWAVISCKPKRFSLDIIRNLQEYVRANLPCADLVGPLPFVYWVFP